MNPAVNAIAGRLSLRKPQREALEILDRIAELIPLEKDADPAAALAAVQTAFPQVTDFEREFPSVCFALATGVGKTRLMGAFIAYLAIAHRKRNFFVLAPNLTIYDKLIADFTPNTPKYVFQGIAEFAVELPRIITGDDYDQHDPLSGTLDAGVRINIFNISKINTEVRGGKSPRIKRLSEYIGESYFDYLAGLPDLVLLMDESHRYRASAGVRAINELRPVLGLELTATPFVEAGKKTVAFQNVVLDYPLARAMADGFVKEPAVVTRKDFDPSGMSESELERLKLEDGVRLHELAKVELETYARESGQPRVKPFVLVIARDTTHAAELKDVIESDEFFEGRYRGKVIQVDSSKTGVEKDDVVERLLRVERADEPTEIVIHVNMLKEGWDVTNLYTIVPLRAASARTLVEQSIGRGLRLPYGRRTGVAPVDRLTIVAHDRFQEIVDEANRPGSPVRLTALVLTPEQLSEQREVVEAAPLVDVRLGRGEAPPPPPGAAPSPLAAPVPLSPQEADLVPLVHQAIERMSARPEQAPVISHLARPDVRAQIVSDVLANGTPLQLGLAGTGVEVDVAALVEKLVDVEIRGTINIPRIAVVPTGEVEAGFHPFALDLESLQLQPPSEELWVQYLRTAEREVVGVVGEAEAVERLEDYVVRALLDFDDIAYEEHASLLYELAAQVVARLRTYLSDDDVRRVLVFHARHIAQLVHVQMDAHRWERAGGYEVQVRRGFVRLRRLTLSRSTGQPVLDFRFPPDDLQHISRSIFGCFERCLYGLQKFDSDTERRLAVLLDRDTLRWFRPAAGQFDITYRWQGELHDYRPDFVAETESRILMLETKARGDLEDPQVQAKRVAAEHWCERATAVGAAHGAKPWAYALIPHDLVKDNMAVDGLVDASVGSPGDP